MKYHIPCPVCGEGHIQEIDVNGEVSSNVLTFSDIEFVCDNCGETYKQLRIYKNEDNILTIEFIK